jgi:hypothetical protein
MRNLICSTTVINASTGCLGGVVVSMLVIRPKICGLKPGRDDAFLRVMKICSLPSFDGEVKLVAPYCKIL